MFAITAETASKIESLDSGVIAAAEGSARDHVLRQLASTPNRRVRETCIYATRQVRTIFLFHGP